MLDSPVGKRPPGFTGEVEARAVEAGARAERAHGVKVCQDFDPRLPGWDDDNMLEQSRENYRNEARRIIEAALPVLEEKYARDFNDILDTAQEADEENVRRWDQMKARIRELENEIARLNGQTVSADERDGLNREVENFADEVERLEAQLAAADRLAEVVEEEVGGRPGKYFMVYASPDADALGAALAAYRESGS